MENLLLDKKTVVETAMNFDMTDIVNRYIDDHHLPEETGKEHEKELKRFLILCALYPEKRYGMKAVLDDLWHEFIIFTKTYERFCLAVAGRFLHHNPNLHKTLPNEDDRERFKDFLQKYQFLFGEDAPLHIWPRGKTDVNGLFDPCDHDHCSRCSHECD